MQTVSCGIELTVIAPFFNEELVIEQSVRRLLSALEPLEVPWELILVNDGSTDASIDIVKRITESDRRIRVLSYNRNRGRGYALRTGFDQSRGRYVITTESDLSWGEQIIPSLYGELLKSGADLVTASPYAKGGKLENVPFRRAFLSSFGNVILRMSVPRNITMLSGMTRGYVGAIIRSIPLEEDGKEIHLEIVSKAIMMGCRFSEVAATLRWEPPSKGKPKRKSSFKAWKLIRSHLLFGFNEAPILLFGTIGALLGVLGMASGILLSIQFFLLGQVIGHRVILILTTVFLILTSLTLFSFCFISYQVKSLRREIFKLHVNREKQEAK
jgi:glycosyltransferase involved in cell wall biosynthesis